MIKEFDPLQYQFATYVIEYCIDIYDKYKYIAKKSEVPIQKAIAMGQADIFKHNDFFFYKMFKDIDFNYNIDLFNMKDEFCKILNYYLKDTEITYAVDEIIINGVVFSHHSYIDVLPNQGWIIEYVGLALIQNHIKKVARHLDNKLETKEYMSVEETVEYTGYSKGYIYQLRSKGLVRGYQNSAEAKLSFKTEELKEFMLRNVTNIIDDLV